MDLDRINVELRPRDGWQSIDLGFQMARQWFIPLMTLWLCLALPAYALLKLFSLPGFATLFIWWWFKPLFEAPLSYWCSRAMFSEQVSHKQALHQTFKNFTRLLTSYLSIRRLSTSRSQNMNVIMLENLSGSLRRDRIDVLNRMATRTFALISVCFHFEAILFYGLLLLCAAFLPDGSEIGQAVNFLFGGEESTSSMLIIEGTTILVAALIAPFYVCAGFSLYINRRTQLEAWDIELGFRRAASRVRSGPANNIGMLAVILLTMVLALPIMPVKTSLANTTTQDARLTIDNVLSAEDFGYTETVQRLRLKKAPDDEDEDEDNEEANRWLSSVGEWLGSLAAFVETIFWVLFAVVVLAIAYAVFKNSTGLQALAARFGFRREDTGSTVFNLDIRPQSLPADIPAVAQNLLHQGNKREAMSLLYRGALSRLVHRHGMTIEASDTEQQCVIQVIEDQPDYRSSTFKQLTSLWQQTAYARTQPGIADLTHACQQWGNAFDCGSGV